MTTFLKMLPGQRSPLRKRVALLYLALISFNIAAWVWAFVAFHRYPLLLGTSVLAYSLGLRHAVDADHIAAIDNVTRKLLQNRQRPIAVGLHFSLGHSTIVVLASIGIAATATALEGRLAAFQHIGSMIGTLISTAFLFAIALINLFVLFSMLKAFKQLKQGQRYADDDIDTLLASRGLLNRLFRPLFKLITKSWHMYFLGLLFGLGFDTATEIGLLGISAAGASQGLPIWSILVFPALFTAGMTLIDTTDSLLMLGAYGWAFAKPARKLYYNITITSMSAVVALSVGSIEGLGFIGDKLQLEGTFWRAIAGLNDNFGIIGAIVIAVFIISWLLSVSIYRWKRYEDIEIPS